ncbi:DNA polymerase IV [Corynebacterium alimapuense]|uniref:DNA polymerase IV n=1 Tax=Corynebacterium alimapuense TaxID=1576874 RepID=A0A3M8K9B6_9CORY|nr:DNA polymerase IV [Corynebacterium alimapuense]RNE49479.1 DNA polymerase IV [Corynebacterium alimapuense]
MQRWVLHIDMDAFYASVEQLTRPTLRGRPVLVAGVSGRGVVAGASYEARALGAHSAMPTQLAARLVGYSAVLVSPRRAVYSAASRRVFELVSAQVEVLEQLSIDEAFLEPEELIGADSAQVKKWADDLRALIYEETGLPASIGAGTGKQFAKIGSGEAKPAGTFVIPADRQLAMLHPLEVAKLWGVGPVTQAKLSQIGIATIGDLAAMTEKEVIISLGGTIGPMLWRLAQGIDDRPVAPRAEAKQISAESTFPRDLNSRAQVDAALCQVAESAHRRLLIDGRGSRTVTVKLKMADFHTESRSATLSYATDDLATLKATAARLVRYPDSVGPIRLVGVGYSGLETARQDVLFPELDQQLLRNPSQADDDFETGVSDHATELTVTEVLLGDDEQAGWRATQDVWHPKFGHGWVQGTGHGIVSVRFETRATGPGRTQTFQIDDSELQPGDPLDSLAWEDWLATTES